MKIRCCQNVYICNRFYVLTTTQIKLTINKTSKEAYYTIIFVDCQANASFIPSLLFSPYPLPSKEKAVVIVEKDFFCIFFILYL